MRAAEKSGSERIIILGITAFLGILLFFSQMSQALAQDLIQGKSRLVQAIQETKGAMKDPNFYALLITNEGAKSDSSKLEDRLKNTEQAIINLEEDVRSLESRIIFFDDLSTIFSALIMMVMASMAYRCWKLCS